ncbi:unnamed protein product [Mycena citricolor]|uniref:Uncharacterized protein n=1 Tax=Mycena citricolor TaxID=2018698 RepID=A0AAD2HS14_9AGAR|nr:unnamed protein product [Mycena citricolor]
MIRVLRREASQLMEESHEGWKAVSTASTATWFPSAPCCTPSLLHSIWIDDKQIHGPPTMPQLPAGAPSFSAARGRQ